jgi:hypothetical protein
VKRSDVVKKDASGAADKLKYIVMIQVWLSRHQPSLAQLHARKRSTLFLFSCTGLPPRHTPRPKLGPFPFLFQFLIGVVICMRPPPPHECSFQPHSPNVAPPSPFPFLLSIFISTHPPRALLLNPTPLPCVLNLHATRQTRIAMTYGAARSLMKCAAIATRFSLVRLQGFRNTREDSLASGEHCVLNYQVRGEGS